MPRKEHERHCATDQIENAHNVLHEHKFTTKNHIPHIPHIHHIPHIKKNADDGNRRPVLTSETTKRKVSNQFSLFDHNNLQYSVGELQFR
jgi:hypothetical protein